MKLTYHRSSDGKVSNVVDRSRSRGFNPVLYSGILVAGFITVTSFAISHSHLRLVNMAIRSDQYRHFSRIVIPVFYNGATPELLWSNHHPSPFLHLYQLANIVLFSFDQRVDFLAGIGASAVVSWLLYRSWVVRSKTGERSLISAALVLVAVAVVMSKASAIYTTWPLVAFQLVFIASGFLFQYYYLSDWFVDLVAESKTGAFVLLCGVVPSVTVVLLLIHGTIGTFFATGAALVLVGYAVQVERRSGGPVTRLVMVAAVTLLSVGGYRFILSRSEYAASSLVEVSIPETLGQLAHTDEYLVAVGTNLLEPTVVLEWIFRALPLGDVPSAVVGLMAIAILLHACRDLATNRFLLAAGLSLSGVLAAVAVAAPGRDPSLQVWAPALDAPRYDHYHAVLLGVLLTLLALNLRLPPAPAVAVVVVALIALELGAVSYRNLQPSEELVGRSLDVANRFELLTYMEGTDSSNDFSLRGTSSGHNPEAVYEPVLVWLRDRQINVFDPGRVHHRHVEGYKAAELALDEPFRGRPAEAGSNGCVALPVDRGTVAWAVRVAVDGASPWHVRVDSGVWGADERYKLVEGDLHLLGRTSLDGGFRLCVSDHVHIESFEYILEEP